MVSKYANWINGGLKNPSTNRWLEKINPATGQPVAQFADSNVLDVDNAVNVAAAAFGSWAATTPVRRGQLLAEIVSLMKARSAELTESIALETGKPPHDAKGEVGGAILQGDYFAGEGMRLYARSLTSGVSGKYSHSIRQPRGVAGLIVPANTPIANIAWKVFPALICGNTVLLKAAEDAPHIALLFAEITKQAGLPDGVFNVIQGTGAQAGKAIVENPGVQIISFTGSTETGKWIAETAGKRLARISLELGGKNPFVVCDDANLDQAVHWASLSAFSNAGQRCAAASRFIVFEKIYNDFLERFVRKAKSLKLGVTSGCDLGPVMHLKQRDSILGFIARAKAEGGQIHCGGSAPTESDLATGFYVSPTIIDGLPMSAELSRKEIFGPVAAIYKATDLRHALELANDTEFGLTAAIHTTDVNRANWFAQNIRAGVINVNLGTFGSEPHMPFGGFGNSGNGTREPGVEALDVYSELKNISFYINTDLI